MSTITVTTQSDLDAALADRGVYRIIIDSPTGVWLSLATDRTDVTVGIQGASCVGPVRGSATVRGVWGSATVRDVWGSATVRDVRDSATVSGVRGSATVRDVWGGCAIVGVHDHARVLDVGPHVTVHLYSATATVDGGVIIDLSTLDLTDPQTWRDHHAPRVTPDADTLRASYVSSQDHPATLTRDGRIVCGCWSGTLDQWRQMAAGDDWPSGCALDTCERYRPRLLAWADLCEQQLTAWAAVTA